MNWIEIVNSFLYTDQISRKFGGIRLNILFLTTGTIKTLESGGIYSDLLKKFRDEGHNVYTVSATQRRNNEETHVFEEENAKMLKVKIGNLTRANLIEKGISILRLEGQYLSAIKKYFSDVKFDLVLYSTPPVTFERVIRYIKNRDGAVTYLLLKDIFPHNAVDLGLLKKSGIKGLIYKHFRRKEIKLYDSSDFIGCMSQANVDFVLEHNRKIDKDIVHVSPNSIDPKYIYLTDEEKSAIRKKYGIPEDKVVFISGGNLGRLYSLEYTNECILENEKYDNTFILIVGSGVEAHKLEKLFEENDIKNSKHIQELPFEEYETMINACDVGLVILNHVFTMPNFPSRILSYMQAGIPVLASTDLSTDMGQIIVDNDFGHWCESNDPKVFCETMQKFADKSERERMGENSRKFLEENYTVDDSYRIIMDRVNQKLG